MTAADRTAACVRVVAEIGHSRLKWAILDPTHHLHLQPPLPLTDSATADWPALVQRLAAASGVGGASVRVALAGSNRPAKARLLAQLHDAGMRTLNLDSHADVPIPVAVEAPERVGLDRLLNALAARARVGPGQAAIIVDAGTAVTVDLLDASGVFAGGAIAPGLSLLPRALHHHTTTLPLLAELPAAPPLPGRNTQAAMQAGVVWLFIGGVRELVERLAGACTTEPTVLVTGGDAAWVGGWSLPTELVPTLTLEGVSLAAAEFLA
jgi:type III pantothenate kinase